MWIQKQVINAYYINMKLNQFSVECELGIFFYKLRWSRYKNIKRENRITQYCGVNETEDEFHIFSTSNLTS